MLEVSVIVIAYNIEDYIQRCLKSLIDQSFKCIEVIVVNDGSTDKTLSYVETFADTDSRVKIVNKKNAGPLEARKSGLKMARGNYILFIDGDDWLHLEAIEKLHSRAISEDADIVLYNYYSAYPYKHEANRSYTDNMYKFNDNLKSSILCAISPSMWSKFIKHEFLLKNEIQLPDNLSYAEDLASIVQLFTYQPRVTVLESNLYYYFQRENSITKQLDDRVLDIPKAVASIRKILVERGLYSYYEEEFNYLAYTHIFYNKIICNNNYIDLHKKLNVAWREQRIKINKNSYYKKLRKDSPRGLRIKLALFNFNYNLGLIYTGLWSNLKALKSTS